MKNKIKLLVFLSLFLFIASSNFAQVIYAPYYGKNKVNYEKFNWNQYKTEHFNIYYYEDDVRILKSLAEMAESAYQRISQELKHPLTAPVPLIFYTTLTDFEQTNIYQVGEGVLGFAEPVLHRVAIHGDMTPDQVQDLIEHELTHIFEFDLLWGSPGAAVYAVNSPPDWIMEGYAEYNTGAWSYWSGLIVRDAVLNDRIPELTESGSLYSRYPLPRQPDYDFGHAMFDFIESKLGRNGIREFWSSLKNSPVVGRRDPLKRALNMKNKEFNQEFKKYLRARHKEFFTRENPEDYSIAIGPEFPLNPYYFSISHAVSPSGDIVAVLTQNYKDWDIDILLISTKDGSVIKNLTKGYSLRYEYIKFEVDPSMGKNLDWSFEGDWIAFFGRSGQKYSLFIVDPLTRKIQKKINVPFDQPSSPCFAPGAKEVLFTAYHKGFHDIFKVDLATEEIVNLTEDDLFEKAPAISPDGKKVVYTIRIDTYDKLFLSPLDDLKKKTQLTFGRGNTIAPHFTPDSKEIYFSGDMREAFNIYSLNCETGDLMRFTDVRTGNFYPTPVANNPKKIVFSSFNKGALQVFMSEFEGEKEKTIVFSEKPADEEYKKFEPLVSLEINEDNIKPHRSIGKLYLAARPPIDTLISTDGSIYGGSAISFSDILADYSLNFMAYQVRTFRSYNFEFYNLKRRLQYMVSAFHYTLFYYSPYDYYDPYISNYLNYSNAIATRSITGLNAAFYYPFNLYYRAVASLGYFRYEEDYLDPYISPGRGGASSMFLNGDLVSASFSLVGETTRFKMFGPVSGKTFALSLSQALPFSNRFIKNTTVEGDFRKYLYLGGNSLFAFRLYGFASRGKNPYISYYGGNNQVRSADYFGIVATEGWYANLELRLPLINIASTFIGAIGPVRATAFFDVTRSKIKGYDAIFATWTGGSYFDPEIRISEAIGSYGYGFEFFMFGFPMHIEFVKRLEWPDFSRPFKFDSYGNFSTRFWIGYDF